LAAGPTLPDLHSRWYYHIGGADAVMGPLNSGVRSVSISGSLNVGAGFGCHGFDPTLGLTTALTQAINNIKPLLTNAVTSAVSALPGLILQRANPGLYEMYQEFVSYANAALSLATKSCEQMQSDSAQGRNPFDKWMTLSRSYTWKDQAGKTNTGTKDIDVLQALGVVEQTGGDNGVPWAGGAKAGGNNQPPIKLVSDVARAGYNIEQNQSANVLGTGDGDTSSLVAKSWANPQDAVAFAVAVLGDMEIATKSGATPAVTPGHGLLPQIEKDRTTMAAALADLVRGATQPTPGNLALASSPHTLLNRDVLEAIRKLSPAEQSIAVGRLASEAAVAANVEKALMLRRLLLAGWGEPHIYAAGVTDDIQRLVTILDREVDQLLYESRVRKELVSSSAAALLDMSGQEDSRPTTPFRPGDAKPVIDSGAKR
jgi:integrating conjugative element protein (TIGR03755 family)